MRPIRREYVEFRYLAVAETLKSQVLEGVYQPGEQLPRQHDLAAEHNVAFATLKKALDILENDGYVVRRVGRGTYAALPEVQTPIALVVDDEQAVRDSFAEALGVSGWNCVTAQSGIEALQRLREERFELIFLDLVMPGMNGAATFREIRNMEPEATVVIITGYPDSDLMVEALETGPFAVMKKPTSLEDIRWVLNRSGVRSTAGVP